MTPETRKKILTRAGWTALALFSLTLFTLFKLPDDRIKDLIESNLKPVLRQNGITYTAADSSLSYLFGPSYILKDVRLTFLPTRPTDTTSTGHIDKLVVSPSLFSFLMGRTAGSFLIESEEGSLSGSFSSKPTKQSFSVRAKKFNLGKIGAIPPLLGIQGAAVLDGSASVAGDFAVPSSLEGDVDLQLSKAAISAQFISGFSIPPINLSEAVFRFSFASGKATVKTLSLGKPGNPAQDLQGIITGDAVLGKDWYAGNLNLKATFSISETLKKSFILIDAILGQGKQADGSYAYQLTGPIAAPVPNPIKL